MNRLRFVKMHGCGNDYVIVDGTRDQLVRDLDIASLARRVSDRHKGVGSDGVIVIDNAQAADADVSMRIFNADGGEAQMCGNGVRCVGKYVHEWMDKGVSEVVRVETVKGIVRVQLHEHDGEIAGAEVDMGEATVDRELLPVRWDMLKQIDEYQWYVHVHDKDVMCTFVSVGNPHAVVFVDDVREVEVDRMGAAVEVNEAFPERMNVQFAEVIDESRVRLRTWERGSGETLACGTGACASVVVGRILGKVGNEVTVEVVGGVLGVRTGDNDRVFLSGPCEAVFEGVWWE